MQISIGEIVSSENNKLAVAHSYLVKDNEGNFHPAKNPMIKISPAAVNGKHCIMTNPNSNFGIVCFMPKVFEGYGITRIEIRRIMAKSLFGIPVEYLQATPRLEDSSHTGADIKDIYNKWNEISKRDDETYFVKWYGKSEVTS